MKQVIVTIAAAGLAWTSFAQTETMNLKQETKKLASEERNMRHEKKEDKRKIRELNRETVSYQSREQFARDFENTTASYWEKKYGMEMAHFIKDGQETTAYYDANSSLVGTTRRVSFSELPGKTKEYINKRYKDYSVKGVLFFEDNTHNDTDMILYGTTFADADNYFVELQKGTVKVILKSDPAGNVNYFEKM